jgi:hypothetical protein
MQWKEPAETAAIAGDVVVGGVGRGGGGCGGAGRRDTAETAEIAGAVVGGVTITYRWRSDSSSSITT